MKPSSILAAAIVAVAAATTIPSAFAQADSKQLGASSIGSMDRMAMEQMMNRCKEALANPDESNRETRENCEAYRW